MNYDVATALTSAIREALLGYVEQGVGIEMLDKLQALIEEDLTEARRAENIAV